MKNKKKNLKKEEDDVFVKPKKSNEKNKTRSISNSVSNKYIYKGKIKELKCVKKKKETEKSKKKKIS